MTMTEQGERTIEFARSVAKFWSALWRIPNWRLRDWTRDSNGGGAPQGRCEWCWKVMNVFS